MNRKYFIFIILILTIVAFNIIQMVVEKKRAEILKVKSIKDQNILADIVKDNKKEYIRLIAMEMLYPHRWQNLFIDILKNDENHMVRRLAVKYIDDQNLLASTAKHDEDKNVRYLAMKKLTKHKWQKIFLYIAKNDKNIFNRWKTVERLTDQKVLIDFAQNDKNELVQSAAILNKNLRNRYILEDFAKNSKNKMVRGAAVKRLKNQTLLLYIVKNDDDKSVRILAVKQISEQRYLIDIAKNDSKWGIRCAAVKNKNFINQTVLKYIAENDRNKMVRKFASGKLYDLTNLVKNDEKKEKEDISARIKEISRLSDQRVLFFIADTEKNEDIRFFTVQKLRSQKQLLYFARNDRSYWVRRAAIFNKNFTDLKIIEDIARFDKEGLVRAAAVSRLSNQKVLSEIAKNENDEYVCQMIIYKIKDQKLLLDLVSNARYIQTRIEALKKITDQNILAGIVDNNSAEFVKILAFYKISDPEIRNKISHKNIFWKVRLHFAFPLFN